MSHHYHLFKAARPNLFCAQTLHWITHSAPIPSHSGYFHAIAAGGVAATTTTSCYYCFQYLLNRSAFGVTPGQIRVRQFSNLVLVFRPSWLVTCSAAVPVFPLASSSTVVRMKCWSISCAQVNSASYPSRDGKWVVAYGLRHEGLVWLIGVVVCLFAAPQVHLFASAGSGRSHNAARCH